MSEKAEIRKNEIRVAMGNWRKIVALMSGIVMVVVESTNQLLQSDPVLTGFRFEAKLLSASLPASFIAS